MITPSGMNRSAMPGTLRGPLKALKKAAVRASMAAFASVMASSFARPRALHAPAGVGLGRRRPMAGPTPHPGGSGIPGRRPDHQADPMTETTALASPDTVRSSDFARLSDRVRRAGLLGRRPGYYTVRIGLVGTAYAAGWAAFAVVGDSWYQLIVAA